MTWSQSISTQFFHSWFPQSFELHQAPWLYNHGKIFGSWGIHWNGFIRWQIRWHRSQSQWLFRIGSINQVAAIFTDFHHINTQHNTGEKTRFILQSHDYLVIHSIHLFDHLLNLLVPRGSHKTTLGIICIEQWIFIAIYGINPHCSIRQNHRNVIHNSIRRVSWSISYFWCQR